MAIGTGNIWRFPRVIAQNGGGAFLITWILFLFLWSIPLLMAEFAIGRKTRTGPVGAIGQFIGKKYTWMGGFIAFVTIAIMFYYSVVAGWCINYVVEISTGGLDTINNGQEYWDDFSTNSYKTLFYHFISLSIGAFIIARGITGGVEKATKFLIPSLFVLLVIGLVRGLTLPGAFAGMQFIFELKPALLLDYKIWLNGLTQSAWSTGAGWGLLMTYAVYMREKEDIVVNSFISGLGNNSASLLAAMAIIPAVFALAPALGYDPEAVASNSGPASTGMAFIYIPELFRGMPGATFFLIVFFMALSIAAISSLIAMIELAARSLMDLGWTRKKSVIFIWIGAFIMGAPSAINLNFFQNQDWVWGVGLIISGFMVGFTVIKYGVSRFRTELINAEGSDRKVGVWYEYVMKYGIPIQATLLLGWWIYNADSDFWNPLATFSFGTCLVQWALVITIFVIFNNKIFDKIKDVKGARA